MGVFATGVATPLHAGILPHVDPPGRGCVMDAPPPAQRQVAARKVGEVLRTNALLRTEIPSIEVPVWFHVITDGSKGEVTDAQLQQQIEILNGAYAEHKISFFAVGTDRTDNAAWWRMTYRSAEEAAAKTALNKQGGFLNVYICGIPGSVLGWATWPWDMAGAPQMDGLVIEYRTLPHGGRAPYDLGMTAVHEAGHWLGLYHTFQDGCAGAGDEVDDTPAEEFPASGCPSEDEPKRDTCPQAEGLDPTTNFMDYEDDRCMKVLTRGQATRIRAQVATYRPGLLEASTLRKLDYRPLAALEMSERSAERMAQDNDLDLVAALEKAKGLTATRKWGSVRKILRDDGKVVVEFATPDEELRRIGPRQVILHPNGETTVAPQR